MSTNFGRNAVGHTDKLELPTIACWKAENVCVSNNITAKIGTHFTWKIKKYLLKRAMRYSFESSQAAL